MPIAARVRQAFLQWVDEAGVDGRVFMQLRVQRLSEAGYELRHVADTGKAYEQLTMYQDGHAALRLTRTTEAGQHRPLRSTPDMRRGWVLVDLDGTALWSALNRIYPGAGLHWFQYRSGTLQATSFPETAARQTGIYASVQALCGEPLHAAIRASCGAGLCLRTAVWSPAVAVLDSAGGEEQAGEGQAVVPCKEPCSLFVSFACEILRADTGEEVSSLALSATARTRLAEALRAAADQLSKSGMSAVGVADFSNRMNPRRLRYWAEQLGNATSESHIPEELCQLEGGRPA